MPVPSKLHFIVWSVDKGPLPLNVTHYCARCGEALILAGKAKAQAEASVKVVAKYSEVPDWRLDTRETCYGVPPWQVGERIRKDQPPNPHLEQYADWGC